MAFSEVYVDPSIAADSGTGTIGDPYGDLEYAIRQTTFDTTNGTRVNVIAGTAEVLASTILAAFADTSVTPAWAPTANVPAIIQGCTSVAGDGGVATIDANGLQPYYDLTLDGVFFADLYVTNVTTTSSLFALGVGDNCGFIRVHLDCEGNCRGLRTSSYGYISDCLVENTVDYALFMNIGGTCQRSFFRGQTGTLIVDARFGAHVRDNIFKVSANIICVNASDNAVIQNNSFYSSVASTGVAIQTGAKASLIANNLIEGFSGVGGRGISVSSTAVDWFGELHGNAIYNCTTPYDSSARGPISNYGDNEILTASPFNDAANGDFSPVDTGNVKEGALPQVIGGGLV